MRAYSWLVVIVISFIAFGCSEEGQYGRRSTMTKVAQDERSDASESPTEHNTEAYDHIEDNPFLAAKQNPLSTFSIDVDTAAYTNMRRYLNDGQLPPKDAVRVEELINYFPYSYQPPGNNDPFAAHVEVGPCPWNPKHQLAKIGIKGKEMMREERGVANLVFLVDVSGSMESVNKLPLLQQSLMLLVKQLGAEDRVAIVVYAGASGLVLPSTACKDPTTIINALERLQAGGSTNGGGGIELAYAVALQHWQEHGINRVILCTDGDFNVGITNNGDLTRLIEQKRNAGVYLTVLGFGMGNYKDSTLEKLADMGNGNYAYIDTLLEARKVLVEQLDGTLVTIAKDVKVQVDFNPAHVAAYRLLGYENRLLRSEDFRNDAKDAGEIGAGHTVTALYELVPPGEADSARVAEASKYQTNIEANNDVASQEWMTIKLRYKEPDGSESKLLSFPVKGSDRALADTSTDFRFAAAVAAFGMLLRESEYKGQASFAQVLELAVNSRGDDKQGYRHEFEQLVKLAQAIAK